MSVMNVILYIRVSTDDQAEQGFSLKHQEESLRRYCEIKRYNILKLYSDDHSAKDFNRPDWKELHNYVKIHRKIVHKVLFVKWDRFSRNIEKSYSVLRDYEGMGIEINATEQPLDLTNPDNKLILAMYLSMSEVERDKISSRTKDGTHQAKKEGYYTGRATYGYDNIRVDKKSTLRPNDKAVYITKAFKEISLNVESIDSIRKRLQKEGMNICKQAFYDCLRNVTYAGKVFVPEYKKESASIVEARHEALIDFETFNRVQKIRDGKRWKGVIPSHKNLLFPLRNFLVCDVCGRPLTGSSSKGRNKKYEYYHCRQSCNTRVQADTTHKMVSELLEGLQISSNVKELYADVLRDNVCLHEGDKKKLLEIKSKERKNIMSKIEETEDRLSNRDISPDSFNSMVNRYQSNLMLVNADIEALSIKDDSIKGHIDDGLEMLLNLNKMFLETDYDGKRIIAGSLFTGKVVVGNNKCRTTQVNEVIELFTRNFKDWEINSNEKAVTNDGLSSSVPGGGLEPPHLAAYAPQTYLSTNSNIRAKKKNS